MMLVFLLEEPSMKVFLDGLLPRLLPPEIIVRVIAHEGKTDLEKSLPRKLRGWRTPDTLFFVLRDQDSGDCERIKRRLEELCARDGHRRTRVCIVCRELEAWFIGDLATVGEEFGIPSLADLQTFRTRPSIVTPIASAALAEN